MVGCWTTGCASSLFLKTFSFWGDKFVLENLNDGNIERRGFRFLFVLTSEIGSCVKTMVIDRKSVV